MVNQRLMHATGDLLNPWLLTFNSMFSNPLLLTI
jgi:hypothetical protein